MKYVIEDYVKRPVGFMISRYYGHIFQCFMIMNIVVLMGTVYS